MGNIASSSKVILFPSYSDRKKIKMSPTTSTRIWYLPVETVTLTTNGVVQTGTIATVSLETVTGIPSFTTVTNPYGVTVVTTIDGTQQVATPRTTTTETSTGNNSSTNTLFRADLSGGFLVRMP
jgi:hypothetical protein